MSGIEPGDSAPKFSLKNANTNVAKELVSLEDVMGENGAIIVFECNHCPYVIASIERMNKMCNRSSDMGIGFVGINSNNAAMYPDDSFENMVKRAEKDMPYPYLHDESQEVATEWGAERTPEFFLINSEGVVVYKGRLDNSPRDPTQASTSELQDAIDSMLMGTEITNPRTQSIGCSIKWK
tara:strand:- start:475 stop:1017 length:543 start_codon:yes stop_codon:yes gene_type:complete